MQTDRKTGGGSVVKIYRHPLLQSISRYLSALDGLADPKAKRDVKWTPQAAAIAAVLMALSAERALTDRFHDALASMAVDYGGTEQTGLTYNGLLKALERQWQVVLPLLKSALREHVRQALKKIERTEGWTLLAVDGTKEELPRTESHEQEFGIGDNGAYPQARVTAIVEVHTELVWDWRIDKARGSEKHHLLEMVGDLPQGCLLLADGNFVGYSIWSKLAEEGKSFLIRVGGNVRLIQKLWLDARIERRDDIVYVWPVDRQESDPPLRLRLIRLGSDANPIYLLTNVLDRKRLSDKAAGEIYRLRWGAEMFYRTFKQTLDRGRLRSRTARRGKIELEWNLIATCILTLLGVNAIAAKRKDPRRISPAQLARVVRRSMHRDIHPRRTTAAKMRDQFAASLRDTYQRRRPKASRHRAITTNTPKLILKPPKIRAADRNEKRLAKLQRRASRST